MPVEFLSDQQAAQYAAFNEAPSRAEWKRHFFLDDSDLEKAQAGRRSHNRLGFAAQLTSARCLGRFTPDPRQPPTEGDEYLAEQSGITDPPCLEEYGERDGTARAHAGEVARLSPSVRHHISMPGRCSFQLPDPPGGLRPLRAPGTPDEE